MSCLRLICCCCIGVVAALTQRASVAGAAAIPTAMPRPAGVMISKPTPKYVLVTGGNRGVGFAVCQSLLRASTAVAPIVVILMSRSKASGKKAQEQLALEIPGAEVHVIEADVRDVAWGSHTSASRAIRDIVRDAPLHALVNNAGVALDLPWSPPTKGGDGEIAKQTLETNFLGPIGLTRQLQQVQAGSTESLLRANCRVINISSGGGHIAIHKVKPDVRARFLSPDLATDDIIAAALEFMKDASSGGKTKLKEKWGYDHIYGFSKLCITIATRTLARECHGLIVHACTPGFVLTGMTKGSSATKTPEEAAKIILYLVLSEDEVVMTSGKFFNPEGEVLAWDDRRYMK